MISVLVHHKVADYQRWKATFDSSLDFRHKAGEQSCRIFFDPDKENDLTLLFEWEDVNLARRFMNSSELRERMKEAGVLDQPTIEFLHEMYTVRRSAAD
ncbi:MAG TPA: hypothetical protein VFA89_06925 [Terriglobales bacterium]|nr:hypothetical protein [Terriglobales bacterium]